MTFGFSLYAIPLLVTQVTYLGSGTWELRVENYQGVARCIIANTGKKMLVLVNFQDDYHSVNYWIKY